MSEPIHIISLGAGVQSSTMALMAAVGEILPMPVAAVFADTQAEPKAVYEWLEWLKKELPFPVYCVSKGNLAQDACRVRHSKSGKNYTKHVIPAFITDGVSVGLAMRQCTTDHKIDEIYRQYTRLRNKGRVIQWIGISYDEVHRMKPARRSWVENRYPLVDARISRQKCLQWMSAHGYPTPPRSACTFCPYHGDAEWRRMKADDPESFESAAVFEGEYQAALKQVSGFRGIPYLHRSCVPLRDVDFRTHDERSGQGLLDGFGNECEGMCGV